MKRLVTTLVLFGAVSLFPAQAQDGGRPPQGQSPAAARDARIAELVRKLGDPSFDAREAAQRELIAIGGPALKALDEATRSADPEVASRATEAISRIRAGGREPQPEQPQVEERDPGLPPDMPPMPDMRDMFKELEGQLPAEFGEMLKELFQGRLPGQDEQGEPEERRPGQPRVRVWNWSSEPRPNQSPGSFDRALGAEVAPASPALRAQLGISGDEGLVINQLDPEGRAAKAGVQLYDVIVGVDGRSVRSARDLRPLVQGGGKVELYRRAQSQTIEVPAPAQAKPAPAPTPTPPSGNGERSF